MALPDYEMKDRLKKVQNLLLAKGLPATLVYYDELNIANGWYLSGWCPQFESGCLFIPREGEPIILGGPESEPFAKTDSSIKKTRNIPVFMVPEEEYPNATISSFAGVFEEVGIATGNQRIGVVGLDKMPFGVYQLLKKDFQGIELIDITVDYEQFRKVKSAWEQQQVERAFAITDQAFRMMEPMILEGVSEIEIAGAGEGKARSLGANWFAFKAIVASGTRTSGVVPTASDKKLQAGETVMLGLSPRFNGYAGVAGYTTVVGGKPGEAQRRCINDMIEAYRITKSNLKPGMVGKDINAATHEFVTRRGYGKNIVCPFAHTIGLMEAEAPFFGPNSRDVLQPGMTVCIDVSVFSVPEVNGVRFETGYLITERGPEPLSLYMDQKILNTKV